MTIAVLIEKLEEAIASGQAESAWPVVLWKRHKLSDDKLIIVDGIEPLTGNRVYPCVAILSTDETVISDEMKPEG